MFYGAPNILIHSWQSLQFPKRIIYVPWHWRILGAWWYRGFTDIQRNHWAYSYLQTTLVICRPGKRKCCASEFVNIIIFFYHFSFASCLNLLHNCLTYGRLTKNELRNTFFSLMGTCEPILKVSVASASQKAQRNNGRKKKPAQAREKRECTPRAHLFSLTLLIS